MSGNNDQTEDDMGLTKPKKKRSEAQNAATERMRTALRAKGIPTGLDDVSKAKAEKQLRLQAIKEQLNGPLKKNMDKTPTIKKEEIQEHETEVESEEEAPPSPISKKKEVKVVSQTAPKPKKEPKIIYESASESEEEVIIVKKKKKQKPRKTIIYESATESEEEAPPPKSRDTKTQQNASSKFKVTQPEVKPKGPVYYFA